MEVIESTTTTLIWLGLQSHPVLGKEGQGHLSPAKLIYKQQENADSKSLLPSSWKSISRGSFVWHTRLSIGSAHSRLQQLFLKKHPYLRNIRDN